MCELGQRVMSLTFSSEQFDVGRGLNSQLITDLKEKSCFLRKTNCIQTIEINNNKQNQSEGDLCYSYLIEDLFRDVRLSIEEM